MTDPWTTLWLGIFATAVPIFLGWMLFEHLRDQPKQEEEQRAAAERQRRAIITEERERVAAEAEQRIRDEEQAERRSRQLKCTHDWSRTSPSGVPLTGLEWVCVKCEQEASERERQQDQELEERLRLEGEQRLAEYRREDAERAEEIRRRFEEEGRRKAESDRLAAVKRRDALRTMKEQHEANGTPIPDDLYSLLLQYELQGDPVLTTRELSDEEARNWRPEVNIPEVEPPPVSEARLEKLTSELHAACPVCKSSPSETDDDLSHLRMFWSAAVSPDGEGVVVAASTFLGQIDACIGNDKTTVISKAVRESGLGRDVAILEATFHSTAHYSWSIYLERRARRAAMNEGLAVARLKRQSLFEQEPDGTLAPGSHVTTLFARS